MVRLPMSDDAASYYKEQRIEFTFRQQAHFCWAYDPLLKDRMKSLREILEISDDERLNMEIRQRLAYEEEIYARFMANDMDGCIYVVHPDDENEYEDGYFRSAQSAIAYGTGNCAEGYRVVKRCLLDRCPRELPDGEETDGYIWVSAYGFRADGEIEHGYSYELHTGRLCQEGRQARLRPDGPIRLMESRFMGGEGVLGHPTVHEQCHQTGRGHDLLR